MICNYSACRNSPSCYTNEYQKKTNWLRKEHGYDEYDDSYDE